MTFVILLERNNVIGGKNLVVERGYAKIPANEIPDDARLAEITLQDGMDMLAVDDRRVAHYVYPVLPANGLAFLGRGPR